jgi:hypothetical protein
LKAAFDEELRVFDPQFIDFVQITFGCTAAKYILPLG